MSDVVSRRSHSGRSGYMRGIDTSTLRCDRNKTIGLSGIDIFDCNITDVIHAFLRPRNIGRRNIGSREQSHAGADQIEGLSALVNDGYPTGGRAITGAVGILLEVSANIAPGRAAIVRSK